MRLFERASRSAPAPELDARLHDIFDDRRTPGAPETLYRYLREVSMESSPTPGHGRLWLAWNGLGRMGRATAALAVVAVLVVGTLAITASLPQNLGAGSRPSQESSPVPTAPPAPAGWTWQNSFGNSGGLWVGAQLAAPAPRIAIHVICKGSESLIVFASTKEGPLVATGSPAQAVVFECSMDGQESRAEFAASGGEAFVEVDAVAVGNGSALTPTSYVVSVEVPTKTLTPSASSQLVTLPSISAP